MEVPSFHIPTLNIGERQKGRTHGDSVYDCSSDMNSIVLGLQKIFSNEFQQNAKISTNPYEKADTAKNIFEIISTYPLENLKQKKFYNIK